MPRFRDIKKSFWISRAENEILKNKAKTTGRTESDLFREFIKDNRLSDKPTDEFYNTIQELRILGRNFSKLINDKSLNDELEIILLKNSLNDMDDFIFEIKNKFLN